MSAAFDIAPTQHPLEARTPFAKGLGSYEETGSTVRGLGFAYLAIGR